MTKLFFLLFFISILIPSISQNRCGTMQVYQKLLDSDTNAINRYFQFENTILESTAIEDLNPKLNPSTRHRNATSVVVIPIVVHVVYNTSTQNISDEQIRSQISILNSDYRMNNSDTLLTDHPFWTSTADAEIEFCLATTDPNGDPTNGITRTFTTNTRFDADSIYNWADVKYTATGGLDNWDPNRYLNIWVCNLTGPVLAIATFPTELISIPSEDGITISYKYFGMGGTSVSPYNLGRSMTHEVGHWLGLRHIWGDASCGNDFVADTKVAESENYGCPSFPRRPNNSCGGDANGEMYMNFMDYVNDNCMNMFTFGQTIRMQNTLNSLRAVIPSANRCVSTANIKDLQEIKFGIYPIPAQEELNLYLGNNHIYDGLIVRIMNPFGQIMIEKKMTQQFESEAIDISSIPNGSYIIELRNDTVKGIKKFVILR